MQKNKALKIFALILFLVVVGVIVSNWGKNRKSPTDVTNISPSPTNSPTSEEPEDDNGSWVAYYEPGFLEFEYNPDYSVSGSVASNYLALLSPLDPDKPAKVTTLGEKELKIEIVIENSVPNDTSEKCFYDHSENPNVLGKENIVVDGVSAVKIEWQGLGTGEFVCLLKEGKRIMINKYPIETTRNDEYKHFLSTFKFL